MAHGLAGSASPLNAGAPPFLFEIPTWGDRTAGPRHDGKRFRIVIGADEYSAEGVSVDDAERFIKQVLDQRADLDRQRSERRNQLPGSGQAGDQVG
jgi:hypothetical protein